MFRTPRSSPARVAGPAGLIAALALLWTAATASAASDPAALLRTADESRGLTATAQVVSMSIDTTSKSGTDHATLEVYLKRDSAGLRQLVRFLAPKRMVGQVFLVVGNNTWMYQPGLQRPIRISAQQKLFGDAGIAEAAGLEYAPNYRVEAEAAETAGGAALRRLELLAKAPDVPYQRVTLWLDPVDGRVVKSVLSTPSGQALKTLTYDQYETATGRPVLKRFVVKNELTKGSSSVLTVLKVEERELSDQLFKPEFMHQAQLLGQK